MSLLQNASFHYTLQKISTHFHDSHQIIFIKEGTVAVTINGEYNLISNPSIIIFNRFDEHSIKILSDRYERYVVRIVPLLKHELNSKQFSILSLFSYFDNFNHIIPTNDDTERFLFYFSNLVDDYEKKDTYSETICEDILYNISANIFRSFPSFFNHDESGNALIKKIELEIANNISEKFTLEGISKKYHISESYLSHIFKKQTGYSLINYLLCCRISTAKKLLIKTNLSIGKICEQIGFSDHSNFSRIFKNRTNLTPKEFREKYKL